MPVKDSGEGVPRHRSSASRGAARRRVTTVAVVATTPQTPDHQFQDYVAA